jgi:Xaa-Pro aminopeptidase
VPSMTSFRRYHAVVSGERPVHEPQQAVYEAVLDAQETVIKMVKPGVSLWPFTTMPSK